MNKLVKQIGLVSLTCGVIFFGWGYWQYTLFNRALEAAGGYPLECGFLKTVAVPCIGLTAVCPQTPMCAAKAVCVPSGQPAFYEIKGPLSGGNPACASGIVMDTARVQMLALLSGPSLIVGGMGPTMMEGGPAATFAGRASLMIRFYHNLAFSYQSLKNWL